MKTAATKDHLLAVERQLDMISKEFQAGKSSIQPTTGFTAQPQSAKKAGKISVGTRSRRQAPNSFPDFPDFNFTTDNVLELMEKYFEQMDKYFENLQLIPIEYCNSTQKLCPAGRPGLPGKTGPRGPRGIAGRKGQKGSPGRKGVPGETGGNGAPGPRGLKGDTGPSGSRGPPGTSVPPSFAPYAMISPAQYREDENANGFVSFNCKVGGNPRPRVSWRFKDQAILSGDKYVIRDDGMLIIGRVNSKDIGVYTCVATNTLGSSEATERISAPQATISPANQTKDEADQAMFHCEVEGYPLPHKIEWLLNKKRLGSGEKYVINGHERTLLIKQLDHRKFLSDIGEYTCTASNLVGSSVATGHLSVRATSCDCWRSASRRITAITWGYRGPNGSDTDAIDFQTSNDVTLLGYRMWRLGKRDQRGRPLKAQVVIRLHDNDTRLMAEDIVNVTYTNSADDAFEVRFSKGISLFAGSWYTATSKITPEWLQNIYCFYNDDGMASAHCSSAGVVKFQSSSIFGSPWNRRVGQIAALIFGSSGAQC